MGFHTLLSLLLVTADSDRRARQRRRFQGSLATSARAGGTAPSGAPLGRPGSPGHSALTTGPAGRHTGSRRGHRSLLAIARAEVPPHAPGLYRLRPEGPRERVLPRTVGGVICHRTSGNGQRSAHRTLCDPALHTHGEETARSWVPRWARGRCPGASPVLLRPQTPSRPLRLGLHPLSVRADHGGRGSRRAAGCPAGGQKPPQPRPRAPGPRVPLCAPAVARPQGRPVQTGQRALKMTPANIF